MKKLMIALSVVSLLGFSNAFAADVAAGKAKAVTCAGCHGPDGISANPQWPNIKGQNAPYIEAQLKAFKSGTRANAMMASIAQGLTDADMANLAAYFASLK
jgi:cytochrome c553